MIAEKKLDSPYGTDLARHLCLRRLYVVPTPVITLDSITREQTQINALSKRQGWIGGWNALMWASLEGNRAMVLKLLSNGANVNLRGLFGCTALNLATRGDNVEVVNALLRAGADPNLQQWDGVTPLLLARERGNVLIVSLLVQDKSFISIANSYGRKALVIALTEGNYQIARELLEARVDPHVNDPTLQESLRSLKTSYDDTYRMLIQQAGRTPLSRQ